MSTGDEAGGTASASPPRRWLREPLVHFLLLGAAIYLLYGSLGDGGRDDEGRIIEVSTAEQRALAERWQKLFSREPSPDERADLIADHVRRQALQREARAMGLDRGDLIVERRLAQKLEQLARGLATPDEPDEAALRAWHGARPDAFRRPALYSFTQLYFSPDQLGEAAEADARAALEAVRADARRSETLGDDLMLQRRQRNVSQVEIARQFGDGFAEAVSELAPGRWHGPVRSSYGLHLVLVDHVVAPPPPPFDTMRARVREAWLREQIEIESERYIEAIVERYEVVIEGAAPAQSATP